MVTVAQNPDGSIAVVVLNQGREEKHLSLQLGHKKAEISINGQAIPTVVIPNENTALEPK